MSDCNCGTTGTGNYFGTIGGQIGDRLEAFGGGLLASAKKRFKAFTGLGEYKLVGNSLVTNTEGGGHTMNAVKHGNSVRITYREYLGDVVTHPTIPGAFNINSFTLNPGNEKTFPWLSGIACQYDQYRPLGIVFQFRSTASDTSLSASIGSVIMATEYDVYDSAFASKSEMLQSAYANESRMSDDIVHGVECDPNELQRSLFYVSPEGVLSTLGDKRDQSMGTFYIATQGGTLAAGQSVGSLYVHYEFEMYKEQIWNGVPSKGLLYSIYDRTITTATAFENTAVGYFKSFMDEGVTAGRDLGLRSNLAYEITVPRWLQGATFKITLNAFCFAGWTQIDGQGITTNIPTWGGTQWSNQKTSQSDAFLVGGPAEYGYIFNGGNVYRAINFSYYGKLFDIMPLDGTLVWTPGGVYPGPTNWPVGTKLRLMFTVYPRNYDGNPII